MLHHIQFLTSVFHWPWDPSSLIKIKRTPQQNLENPAIPFIIYVGHDRDGKNAIHKYPCYLLTTRQEFYVFIQFILAFFSLYIDMLNSCRP